jgi:hypothetical protein
MRCLLRARLKLSHRVMWRDKSEILKSKALKTFTMLWSESHFYRWISFVHSQRRRSKNFLNPVQHFTREIWSKTLLEIVILQGSGLSLVNCDTPCMHLNPECSTVWCFLCVLLWCDQTSPYVVLPNSRLTVFTFAFATLVSGEPWLHTMNSDQATFTRQQIWSQEVKTQRLRILCLPGKFAWCQTKQASFTWHFFLVTACLEYRALHLWSRMHPLSRLDDRGKNPLQNRRDIGSFGIIRSLYLCSKVWNKKYNAPNEWASITSCTGSTCSFKYSAGIHPSGRHARATKPNHGTMR